jgi:glycosyltransferase involved in cell wall biosynthesis
MKDLKTTLENFFKNFAITLFSIFLVFRAPFFVLSKNAYRGFSDFCWLARVSNVKFLNFFAKYAIERYLKIVKKTNSDFIIKSFRKNSIVKSYEKKYSIGRKGKQDIFRDIIVLKPFKNNEKGVILLKYAMTFEAFIYFFDISKLLNKYFFILEPCWAGYYCTNILMWIFPKHLNQIFIQCYTEEDFEIISKYSPYLRPVRLGPADWVDIEKFKPIKKKIKKYDLIMVANWAKGKGHLVLFKALKKIKDRRINVILIGYKWAGRSKEDILKEAKIINNPLINIDIEENLPHADVVDRLNNSKVFVFLSQKEGDNKALVEAIFTDVPVIVYDRTVGGAKFRVNDETGIFSSYDALDKNIIYMLDNYQKLNPRKWALKNSGSLNSTQILNDMIKKISKDNNEQYSSALVEKINSPNLAYKNEKFKELFCEDYRYILSCKIVRDD